MAAIISIIIEEAGDSKTSAVWQVNCKQASQKEAVMAGMFHEVCMEAVNAAFQVIDQGNGSMTQH